jgi:hypothetical protein
MNKPTTKKRKVNVSNNPRPALNVFSQTALMLMMQHGSPIVELKSVAHLFGFNSPSEANRAANEGDLPVPVFKQRDSQKAPFLIHVEDMAMHVDKMRQVALDEREGWSKDLKNKAIRT